ncbi:hypothetical protein FFWV33_04420 [Flavobacterium faecale]|uniref:Uncharacterized protein n=1 Tax=Flavobacterium faecale TaxID=1355330 RepID=A0A2S1LAQ4_9FLAO|nr:hypothetical protein [Flavobacterium faecale]AWG20840.1 hypothetical protein FFWV33_04420 [Flavobacterium faecale]
MEIITLESAFEIARNEFKKFISENSIKYKKNDFSEKGAFYLECSHNEEKHKTIDNINISFREDDERRKLNLPKNLSEYHKQGGGKELERKIIAINPEAWKCSIYSQLENFKKFEYGIELNESNFTVIEINKLFKNYLL